tara:strand:+ start:1116 stop:1436 length:321 start_codon:yes stop_codon:yes gene_type:complete
MKRKYFPNNWRAIKDTPDKFFTSIPYEQFEDWKIYGYMLPDSVFSLIRTKDMDGKVQEYFYNTPGHTKNRISKSIKENKEIYLCTMEGMYHLKPDELLPTDFNNEQ